MQRLEEPLAEPPFHCILSALHDNVAVTVLSLLDVSQRCICSATSLGLRAACLRADSQATHLRAGGIHGGEQRLSKCTILCWQRFKNLCILELLGNADDFFLQRLNGLLPALRTLNCARSESLTDAGVFSLAADAVSRSALRHVDFTFCQNTTYGATIKLRRALPSLELIRRQPAWLDAHFLTPFGGDGASSVEKHTYYADGAFNFSRREQSRGYVRFFRESDEGFLFDSLQYSNFGGVTGSPAWGQLGEFVYRPGVALRPVGDLQAFCDTSASGLDLQAPVERNVLVAQALSGLRVPPTWPPVNDDDVPLGQSVFLLRDGTRLPTGIQLEEASAREAVSMVSRMELRPLDTLMPPAFLVDEIEAFELQRESFESQHSLEMLEAMEEALHRMLGGD
eukprot:TRINITY_DN78253_c0_g1_i1.p1 TRINITY_DN78253_c0_g1~~TRINITY_DN78253_c0_g1_i1.p1  ORF type:complete len:396 (-),score=49.02 TRINITY_DN78253_c0_g1_i1:36-1223(-)